MLVRTAIFMASLLMGAQAFAADTSISAQRGAAAATRQAAPLVIAPPFVGQLADSGNSGPAAEQAQDLKRVVVYATIGNRDGMEIASARLRQSGVTREEVQDAIERTKLHGGGTIAVPQLRESKAEFSSGRALEVSY